MKIAIIAITTLLILFPNISEARHYYIKPDSTGDAINIQAGIDSCGSGDTVLVAPGIFRGDGNRDLDFKGKAILVISEFRLDSTVTDSTIIDCEGNNNDCHRGFYFHSGETNVSILEGFIIENGYSCSPLGVGGGGGVCCDSFSCPIIRYNTIRHCRALQGGAICCISSSPVVENNKIYDDGNLISPGSAIYCESASAKFLSNEIYDNRSLLSYGGIICASCPLVTIENNDIYRNMHAGIYLWDSHAIIHNNRISNNMGGDGVGGIECCNSNVVITNNELVENSSSMGCPAIGLFNSAGLLDNNLIGVCTSLSQPPYIVVQEFLLPLLISLPRTGAMATAC